MKKIGKRALCAYILLAVFAAGLIFFYFRFCVSGGSWALSPYNRHIYSEGNLKNTGTVTDRNGEVLAQTQNGKREYYNEKAVRKSLLHIIGDNTGNFGGSVQTAYADTLAGYSLFNGIETLKEWNKVPNLQLTIDLGLQKAAAQAFGSKKGAVICYNYKTGEILCSLSAPNYDPANKPDDLSGKKYEGIYVNRAFSGLYAPGSTFKIITAVCALENIEGIEGEIFECKGKYQMPGGGIITCTGKHGKVDLKTGFSVSCNVVFAQIAARLGAEKLNQTAEKFGFNSIHTIEKLTYSGGYYQTTYKDQTDLAWSGIGQSTVLASPINMMLCSATVAGGGKVKAPALIKNVYSPFGIPTKINVGLPKSVITPEISSKLTEMMKMAAEHTFGKSVTDKYSLRCKTGTAEVEDGSAHAWLTAFCEDESHPYAFCIIVEHGGNAASSTSGIATALLRQLYK
ncbi:MAG: hypothetical protein KBS41_05385 [Oscillospiraceae bacterium]|nr:hypothetical protein [Candidatus Equicaccousia limihippi]